MCVHASAGLEFQHLSVFIDRPDSSKSRIEMAYHRLSAIAQHLTQISLAERPAHVGAKSYLARLFRTQFLGNLPLGDIHRGPDRFYEVARLVQDGTLSQGPIERCAGTDHSLADFFLHGI